MEAAAEWEDFKYVSDLRRVQLLLPKCPNPPQIPSEERCRGLSEQPREPKTLMLTRAGPEC